MNAAKEKKLNEKKTESLEKTNFVTLNENADKDIKINSDDTLTLTNIVNSEHKVETNDDLTEIKNELLTLKSILTKQEIVLKEILSKIK